MVNKTDFTVENCLAHLSEETSIEPIKIWLERKYKEEINIFGKLGEEYIFTQYHKDCLDPDWDSLDTHCISEIFLSSEDIKILKKQFKGVLNEK